MLRSKFFSYTGPLTPPVPLPGEYYYKPTARTGTAANAAVTGMLFAPALLISKGRNFTRDTAWFDTSRGALKRLNSNTQVAEITDVNTLTTFNTDGYSVGADTPSIINSSTSVRFVNWAFAKAPGFMDIQLYTGTAAAGQVINHNLGVAPELAIVKCRTLAGLDWPTNVFSVVGDLYLNTGAPLTAPQGNLETTQLGPITNATRGATLSAGAVNMISCRSSSTTADYSTDGGVTWTTITIPEAFEGIAFSPTAGIFVARSFTKGYTSTLANVWTEIPSGNGIPPRNVKWTNDRFIGLDAGNIIYSLDGFTWTTITNPFPSVQGFGQWNAIEYGAGKWVAITRGGAANLGSGTSARSGCATSTDLVNWTVADTAGTISGSTNIDCLVYGNGMFVATGYGGYRQRPGGPVNDYVETNANQSYRSVDGITWAISTLGSTVGNWSNLKFANGIFLVVSSYTVSNPTAYPSTAQPVHNMASAVAYSTDGINWRNASLPQNGFWNALVYSVGRQRFYTVSSGSTLGYSILPNAESSNMYNPQPTTIQLGGGAQTNTSARDYVMYLFASLPEISKVGTYSGTGGTQDIDCGFSKPARFVMIKATNGAGGDWGVWDSVRGLAGPGDSTYSLINTTAVEFTNGSMRSTSSGFRVMQIAGINVNALGTNYIFFAIA